LKKIILVILSFLLVFSPCMASASYVLSVGSQNEAVTALQVVLSGIGYLEEKYITGYYGKITKAAVKQYQQDMGIEDDGIAGPATLSSLLGDHYEDFFEVEASRTETAVPAPTSTPQQTTPSFEPVGSNVSLPLMITDTLVPGVSSPLVNVVQERLKELGYLVIDETTNYYGEMTEGAVGLFQRFNDLSVDGMIGPQTFSVLFSSAAVTKEAGVAMYTTSDGLVNAGSYPSGIPSGFSAGSRPLWGSSTGSSRKTTTA